MSLFRQGSQYLAFGLLQLLLDWAVFVAATALGMPAVPGNLLGRTCGALLGFWLNGRFTFARDGQQRLGWHRFGRFLALWLVTTAVSTWLVSTVAATLGLQLAWLAKPMVEGGLAMVTFFLLRHLVFR
ncbi:GtrA family protein [Stenotrophomonas sp. YIM B06876]|uniref:GtrA family protein n=1 Tax=Stenotrophomonas sp. YIM B06876 TaxID=3060211 RepID=UPI00273A25DF|nr:GtrA family protein [Stenotrophomonas sp. YIM B06876]